MKITNAAPVQNMVQEAQETSAQTKVEAAKGDQQAIRKLASQPAANNPQPSPNIIDSGNGKLNAKA